MRKALLALATAAPLLGGCSTVQSAFNWATQTTTTPAEANSVAAAANLYAAAQPVALAAIKAPECNTVCRNRIASTSHALRLDLDDALDAEAAGNSAKVKLAIDAFNQMYPLLTNAIAAAHPAAATTQKGQ